MTGEVANNKLANRIYAEIDYTGEVAITYDILDDEVEDHDYEQAYRIGDLNCLL